MCLVRASVVYFDDDVDDATDSDGLSGPLLVLVVLVAVPVCGLLRSFVADQAAIQILAPGWSRSGWDLELLTPAIPCVHPRRSKFFQNLVDFLIGGPLPWPSWTIVERTGCFVHLVKYLCGTPRPVQDLGF